MNSRRAPCRENMTMSLLTMGARKGCEARIVPALTALEGPDNSRMLPPPSAVTQCPNRFRSSSDDPLRLPVSRDVVDPLRDDLVLEWECVDSLSTRQSLVFNNRDISDKIKVSHRFPIIQPLQTQVPKTQSRIPPLTDAPETKHKTKGPKDQKYHR